MKRIIGCLLVLGLLLGLVSCETSPEVKKDNGPTELTTATLAGLAKAEYVDSTLSLPPHQVDHILHSSSVGRLVTFGKKHPYSVPVSFAYFEGKIVIHSRGSGTKMNNIKKNNKVAFVVDRYNAKEGFASVHIFGEARITDDPIRKSELLNKFGAAYNAPAEEVEKRVSALKGPFKPLRMTSGMGGMGRGMRSFSLVEIIPHKITSKRVGFPPAMMRKQPYITEKPNIDWVKVSDAEEDILKGIPSNRFPPELIKWTLYSGTVGRINTLGQEYPNSVPVNYTYFDGKIYLHSRPFGTKINDIKRNSKVSFSVDLFSKNTWVSVNVFGDIKIVDDPKQMTLIMAKYNKVFTSPPEKIEEALANFKLTQQDVAMMKMMTKRMVALEITPTLITCKGNNVPLNTPKLPYTLEGKLFKTSPVKK